MLSDTCFSACIRAAPMSFRVSRGSWVTAILPPIGSNGPGPLVLDAHEVGVCKEFPFSFQLRSIEEASEVPCRLRRGKCDEPSAIPAMGPSREKRQHLGKVSVTFCRRNQRWRVKITATLLVYKPYCTPGISSHLRPWLYIFTHFR